MIAKLNFLKRREQINRDKPSPVTRIRIEADLGDDRRAMRLSTACAEEISKFITKIEASSMFDYADRVLTEIPSSSSSSSRLCHSEEGSITFISHSGIAHSRRHNIV